MSMYDHHLEPGQPSQFVRFGRDHDGLTVSETINGIFQHTDRLNYQVLVDGEELHLNRAQWLPCIAEAEGPPRIKSLR